MPRTSRREHLNPLFTSWRTTSWRRFCYIYRLLYASPLNEIDHFHVIGQLPKDIMHVLLECVIPHEVTLMLRDLKKYLTPTQLNDQIACSSFTRHEAKVNHPLLLFYHKGWDWANRLVHYLRCYLFIAAQMWNLAINLSLMIGDTIPQDYYKWECFLLLLDILQLFTARQPGLLQLIMLVY